ncbi:hypothetical protein D1AOALGA4SA_3478 [Olavius algarvensis Delta 1 endosymbiont]|nr:hypothetical protein D1AOALGA4SA_3478 [Olavius algarvensis Delta 1 endosymbiont]
MPKKYIIIAGCGIAAIFLFLYGFNYGDTNQIVKIKHSSDTKAHKKAKLAQLTKSDDMVAAILIMPKSYLPALKRFSQSKMAKNIKILRAQLQLQEGKMTAIHQNGSKKQRPSENPTEINTAEQFKEISKDKPAQNEKPILATGVLYLLASAQKARPLN